MSLKLLLLTVLTLSSCNLPQGYKISFGVGTVVDGVPLTADVTIEQDGKATFPVTKKP